MWKVVLLVLSLSGQPIGVVVSAQQYETEVACQAHQLEVATAAQEALDEHGYKDQYTLSDTECVKDDEKK